MKRSVIIAAIILVIAIVVAAAVFLINRMRPTSAGIQIETTPSAIVFINGEQVGKTPYENTQETGEITIKLVPDSFEEPLAPYETKVELVSGVKTVVIRDFGSMDEQSGGAIVSFEKTVGGSAALAVVSDPDSAEVLIDGQTRGFTPYLTDSIVPGEHTLKVVMPGYLERELNVRLEEGYKLIAVFDLAVGPNAQPQNQEASPPEKSKEESKVQKVEILSTPVGFLRVRKEASTSSEEVGRVDPGKEYVLLEEDEEAGWYKIEYEEGSEGWISSRYAEKLEQNQASPSPEPEEN